MVFVEEINGGPLDVRTPKKRLLVPNCLLGVVHVFAQHHTQSVIKPKYHCTAEH